MCRKPTWQKPNFSKCVCRSQGIDGQLVGLEQSHGSSLEPLDKHFQNHGLIYETRKVSKLENTTCYDEPTTFYGSIYATQRPMQIMRKIRK